MSCARRQSKRPVRVQSDTPATSDEQPPLERKLLTAVIRQAPVGISIAEAPTGRILALSEKAKELLKRDEVGEGMARYRQYTAFHQDGQPYEVEEYPTVRTLKRGEIVEREEMLYRPRGEEELRRLEVSSAPIRHANGDILAAVTIIDDVEDQRRAEERLRASEERLRLVSRATNDAVMDWNLQSDTVVWNEAIETVFGYGEEAREVCGRWWTQRIHPAEAPAVLADLEAAIATGAGSWGAEYRFMRADGSYAHVVDRALIVRDKDKACRIVGSLLDITARKQAETALRESEERLREFGEASADVLWIRNAADGLLEYVSPAFEQVYGARVDDMADGRELASWMEFVLPEDRDAMLANLRRVRSGERVSHEFRVRRPCGEIRWLRSKDFPLLDGEGRVHRIAGIGRDVTEEKRGSERQNMLVAELQHRVRNILAMLRSIARRTAKGSETVADYSQRLESIIAAMARTQALLTKSPGKGADLGTLVLDELRAHNAAERQYRVEGPSILLPPKAAEVLTLALHELATNALKYGALSNADAQLRVSWSVEAQEDAPWLRLTWTETGGEIAEEPRRRGFGTELVTQRVPFELGGRGSLEFGSHALLATIEFPLVPGESILQTDAMRLTEENA